MKKMVLTLATLLVCLNPLSVNAGNPDGDSPNISILLLRGFGSGENSILWSGSVVEQDLSYSSYGLSFRLEFPSFDNATIFGVGGATLSKSEADETYFLTGVDQRFSRYDLGIGFKYFFK